MPRPPLIGFIADTSARAIKILENLEHINALPFDGFTINLPASWSANSPGTVLTEAAIREWLVPLAGFNRGKDNWLLIENDNPGDVFDDAVWAQVTANWRLLAKVAEETGFKGILFDNEEYQGMWDNFPEEYPNPVPGKTMEDYRDQAAIRGREIMEAIAEVFPDAKVAVAHGPYVSVPQGIPGFPAFPNQSGDWDQQELSGAFFTGLLEGLGAQMRLVDGGELYALRSAADFAASFEYRNNILPGVIPWEVDADALANWADRVDQGHMVYTDEYPEGYVNTPQNIVRTLLNAFDHSESAVFLFMESGTGWLTKGNAPKDWIAALSRATELADHTRIGSTADERFLAGSSANRLIAGSGDDTLVGRSGADWLMGDGGRDQLFGGNGRDNLFGGLDRDVLDGGSGDDWVRMGGGNDTFVLRKSGGNDRIIDFDADQDKIDVVGPQSDVSFRQTDAGLRLFFGDAGLLLVGVSAAPGDVLLI
jgi:hypothetical protein